MKRSTSFRLSERALATLRNHARELGISQTSVLELMLGEYFIELPKPIGGKVVDGPGPKTEAYLKYHRDYDGDIRDLAYAKRTYSAGFHAGYYAWQDKVHPTLLAPSASLSYEPFWDRFTPMLSEGNQLSTAQVFYCGYNDGWYSAQGSR